ncbi:hypothetical protein B0H19DRAFT_1071342 [Mycena capillaripes]|nr:hypothetical protein B0H19DRAFT_1071342 [Mycena capillaripes]
MWNLPSIRELTLESPLWSPRDFATFFNHLTEKTRPGFQAPVLPALESLKIEANIPSIEIYPLTQMLYARARGWKDAAPLKAFRLSFKSREEGHSLIVEQCLAQLRDL